MSTATALLQRAQALDSEARTHKRMERYHREQAQRARRELDRLIHACRRAGIDVRLVEPRQGPSDG